MKKLLIWLLMVFMITPITLSLVETPTVEAANTYVPKKKQKYIKWPKGGCYYWNKNGNKTYVARYLCN